MVFMFLKRGGWCQNCWSLLKACDARETLDETDIEDIMNMDDAPVVHLLTYRETMEMV